MRVAILGAGLMGAQIGCEYALGGHDVILHARDPDAAWARAQPSLTLVGEHGLRGAEELRRAADRMSDSGVLSTAAEGVDLVVEALPEDLDLKVGVLRCALGTVRRQSSRRTRRRFRSVRSGRRSIDRSRPSEPTT